MICYNYIFSITINFLIAENRVFENLRSFIQNIKIMRIMKNSFFLYLSHYFEIKFYDSFTD